MVRLAHLSDIHLTTPALEWHLADWFSKRTTSWFNHRWLGRGHRFRHADEVIKVLMADLARRGIDHIVFSGDATALGFESELRRAAECLQVQTRSGLAVPGNHDYCTAQAARSGLFERYFAPWQQGERIDAQTYPFAQKVGPVWLIGVNSATGNRAPWNSGGGVGPAQLERLRRLLARLDPGPRILVTHYPVCVREGGLEPFFRRLRDWQTVVEVAAAGDVRLWLHGHRHGPYHLVSSNLAPFPLICTGSATQSELWSYHEYEVDESRLRAARRVFDPVKRTFEQGVTFDISLAAVARVRSGA